MVRSLTDSESPVPASESGLVADSARFPEGGSGPAAPSTPTGGDAAPTGRIDAPAGTTGPRRRWPARLLRSPLVWAMVLLGSGSLYGAVNFVDVWMASRTEYVATGMSPDGNRAAIVLGAAQYNGEPSPVLRARLDEAAALYEAGEVDLVVVTGGGQPADITTEAKTGYDYLREVSGIPDERLRLEVQGSSTYESLAASARFLVPDGIVDVVLVTDRYHARRSLLIADEVGLRPVVALTPAPPTIQRLAQETAAVALGRLIGFRRLDQI